MLENIDWNAVAEGLKTENIIKYVSSVDPVTVLTNPYFWIPAIIVCLALFFLGFKRILAILFGSGVLWFACYYMLPKNGQLDLHNIAVFGTVFVGVLGFWIYMFLLRSD